MSRLIILDMKSKLQNQINKTIQNQINNKSIKTVDYTQIFKMNDIPLPPIIINRSPFQNNNKKDLREYIYDRFKSERNRIASSIEYPLLSQKNSKKFSISSIMQEESRYNKQKLNTLDESIRYKLNAIIQKNKKKEKQWIDQQYKQISPRRLIKKYHIKKFQNQDNSLVIHKKKLEQLTIVEYQKSLNKESKKKENQIKLKMKQRKKDQDIQENKQRQSTKNIIQKRVKNKIDVDTNFVQMQSHEKKIKFQKKIENIQRIVSQKKHSQLPLIINRILSEVKDIRPWTNHANLED